MKWETGNIDHGHAKCFFSFVFAITFVIFTGFCAHIEYEWNEIAADAGEHRRKTNLTNNKK